MAINFPSAPVNGDTYSFGGLGYTFNGTVWMLSPGPTTVVSAVAPTSPVNGSFWYDLVSGVLFMYVNDGSSSQWIETGAKNSVSFSATSLPGMLAWYDFSDTATLTLNATKISAIADKSGSGRTLSQATDASRWSTGGTVNGLNAAICGNAQTYTWAADPVLATDGYYAFAVFSAQSDFILLDGNGAGVNPYLFSPRTGGPAYCSTPNGNISVAPTAALLTDTQVDLYTMSVTPAGAAFSFNSDVAATGSTLRTGFNLKLFGGRGSFQGGRNVCEVIFGNAALTAQQIADTKSYLKSKWGTA